MSFKIKDVRVYRNKRVAKNQITPEAIVRGPNDSEFYRGGKTVQELDEKLYNEFGLRLEENHVRKIITDAGFHAVFGGIRKGKEYKKQKNIL